MSTWNRLALSIPPEIAAAGQAASQALNTVKTALEGTVALLRIALATASDPTAAPVLAVNAAIGALVGAVNDAIDALLDDVGVYVLPIPLPKRGFARVLAGANPSETGSNYLQFPADVLVGSLTPAERAALRRLPLWQQILDSDTTFLGGNAYFVRTLAEAVTDAGDVDRPRFARSDAWAYGLVVAGAPDVTSLGAIAAYIDRTFAPTTPGVSRGTVSIVPANPRVRLSGRERHAVIEWDAVPVSRLLASYDNSSLVATEFVVVRSTDFRAKTAIHVHELFDTATLTDGQVGRFGARVVFRRPFDGVTSRWEDPTPLAAGTTYYYHVAFRGELRGPADQPQSQTTPVPYGPLSRCLEVASNTRRTAPSHGAPPDWIRSPSLARAIPAVEALLDTVQEQLTTLARTTQSFADRNNEVVAALENDVAAFATRAEDLLRYTNAVVTSLAVPTGGPAIAVKVGVGTGDVGKFVAAVADDFADTSDANRPAFDTGNEFVIGAVVLFVGPDPRRVASALALFTTLFGGGAAADDPVVAGVRSITQTVVDVTAEVDAQIAALMPPTPAIAFDAAMAGAASGSDCDAAPPAEPTFDASMNPTT